VHEATNAYFPKHLDERASKHSSISHHEADTILHGHSTPQMAGRFAARVGAKRLLLTHFSPRYCGDSSEKSMRMMWDIEDLARNAALREHTARVKKMVGIENTNEVNGSLLASAVAAVPARAPPWQGPNDVVAAWDRLSLSVPSHKTATQ
jgi:hypothetical protein